MTTYPDVVDVLDLEPRGDDTYRGQNLSDSHGVVFGGQLMAQIITAAALAVPDKEVKSVHNIFTRGGDPEQPVDLIVDKRHGGRSFATVAVNVSQGARLCTTALVLLHSPEPNLIRFQVPMPIGPTDEGPSAATGSRGWELSVVGGIDINDPAEIGPPELNVWSRFRGGPHEYSRSQALLAYASDGFLIGTAMRPHKDIGMSMAHVSISTSVITQTLTFHERFDAADWHLLAHESPYAGQGRSFGRANVFTATGNLVASFNQENMIRAYAPGHQPAPGTKSKY